MLKSLELLKNGFRGLTSASLSEQSLSRDSKPAQSELKKSILKKVQEVTNGIPQQPIILSVVGQALATTNEKDLLHMIRLVSVELNKLVDEFGEYAPDIPNNYESQNVVTHTDSFDLNLITD
jgi:hypothetical protein